VLVRAAVVETVGALFVVPFVRGQSPVRAVRKTVRSPWSAASVLGARPSLNSDALKRANLLEKNASEWGTPRT